MKTTILLLSLSMLLAGCGGAQLPTDDHITQITEQLQPVVDDWRLVCQTGRACLEAAGQLTDDYIKACEDGWRVFQAIEAYQTAYCQMRGLECSVISSK